MIGIVKWFNKERGYGFIRYEDKDIYVHYSSIVDQEKGMKNLIEGEQVKFNLVETIYGLRAKNVRSA